MKNIYINWASYDELSDNVELDENLALFQLDQMIRLRKKGMRLDYYLMDAFWYGADSGFLDWRKPHWKKGPAKWLETCRRHDIIPGLWLPTNNISVAKMRPFKKWENSLSHSGLSYCMFKGDFLNGLIHAMDFWAGKGVRLFKFDFADFDAATPDALQDFLPHEIRSMNEKSLRSVLCGFRRRHPDALLLAYNGFGGQISNTSLPFRKTVDSSWLACFDAMYCGDPRPADVPCMNFWRSKDIYSDHMVREFFSNGIPLERIDNSAFMIGKTGTCYYRGKEAWKGMLVLSLARGSHFNTYYGNLELLDDNDAAWMKKAQDIFLPLTEFGRTKLLGGIPGKSEAYGYLNSDGKNSIVTLLNPSQKFTRIELGACEFRKISDMKILFADSGFVPRMEGDSILLGPEQTCVLASGELAKSKLDLGRQTDLEIPLQSQKLAAKFAKTGHNRISTEIKAGKEGRLRVVMRQSKNGMAFRSNGGAPPNGKKLGEILKIEASRAGEDIPVKINYDKAIWSGLSWAAGELEIKKSESAKPLTISVSSAEKLDLSIDAEIYFTRKA